jgi:hypothetical protein
VLDVLHEIVDEMMMDGLRMDERMRAVPMKMGGLMMKMGAKKDDHWKVAQVDHR